MFFVSEECFNISAEQRVEAALKWLHMFNESGISEDNGAVKFGSALYDLAYAFFQIRTMIAKDPDSVPHDWLLRRELSRARRNVLARYPRLLNGRLVNEGFNALEALFDLVGIEEIRNRNQVRTKALAGSHFFQNILHNIYIGSRFGLLDIDRALEQPPFAPISPTHNLDQRLLI